MITPYELADRHLRPYSVRGDEIVPRLCPYCKGGEHQDKNTFALNVAKKTFNCKRGSCGRSGSFERLSRDMGEAVDPGRGLALVVPRRTYRPPTTKAQPLGPKARAYLEGRGISQSTWERRRVGEYQGAIAMPFYENGEPVLMKFRPAHPPAPGESKGWREQGGKPVFWGLDDCDPSKPLIVVEGEMDALTLDECGLENVVSVPSGAGDLTCVDTAWERLDQFRRIIIWGDNDAPGQKMVRNLIGRLGAWRCSVVVHELKDANEVLLKQGKAAVTKAIDTAIDVPNSGIISLAEVQAVDILSLDKLRTGFGPLDRVLGGFMMGQVSVWTGMNSSGKSTLLGQVLLSAVDQGYPVCAFSGEMPAAIFRALIDVQAAGPNHLQGRWDAIMETEVQAPDDASLPLIHEWYRGRFYLCDSLGGINEDNLLAAFQYAARRYGCKCFLVDNLMTTAFTSSDRDYYRQQSAFVGRLVDFAHEHQVHVHLVAHPRKTLESVTKMDIAGSMDITNRADNAFVIERYTPEEARTNGYDAILSVLKNRLYGKQDIGVRLGFDHKSRRFYPTSDPASLSRDYGWALR